MALIDNLEAMLARGQDSALLRFGLGGEYAKQQRHADAVVHLRRAVEFDPAYSAAWKLLGQSLTALDQRHEAIEVYTRGIAAAEGKGDIQAAKEMKVFLKRLQKAG